jgi:MYXO-CTERM domain-containing protein
MSTKSFSAKLALSAGSGLLAVSPSGGTAAPVTVDDRPISISFSDLPGGSGSAQVPWDIDGNGAGDTNLIIARNTYSHTTANGGRFSRRYGFLGLAYNFGASGAIFARDYARGGLVVFNQSHYITPDTVNAPYRGFLTGNGIDTLRRYSRTSNGSIQSSSYGRSVDLGFGISAIGFGVDIGGAQHIGWAVLKLEAGPDYRLTVTEWTYESEPDTPIHVDEVPVPSSGIAALTLLGLGAAGVRRMRKRQRV